MTHTRVRAFALSAALLTALTGCGGSDNATVAQSSPTPSGSSCTPSETGTKDLATKPVVTVPKEPAPAETTNIDLVCGTGDEAKDGSSVEVKYVGVLYADGKEFDSSWSRGADDTLPFQIGGGVIPGFSKGTTGMKVGGRRMVIIPSKDGYGDQGTGPIPGGATLIFLIDLVKVG